MPPEAVPITKTRVTQSRLMLPTDANIHGNVHGGMIVKYIDELGGIITARHAKANTVTASIDRMHFYKPVYIGNLLILKGAINYVGRKSMEVGVKVFAEDLTSGSVVHTGSCYSTFVALDRSGNTVPVPPIVPETPEEKHWYEGAKARRQRRLEDREARVRRTSLKAQKSGDVATESNIESEGH
ncbi:MAG: acyl-CoA thioesterase [Euryarchaeota archaeon]|nr:acyl-CoA thioesterase [Euryarchaeota archaeon]